MKKRIMTVALCLCLLAVAAMGTIAYFTDSAKNENTMVFGGVAIEQWEYERELNADGTYKTGTYDGKDSYVLKGFTQDKALFPIVGDPNVPASDPAYAGWDSTTVRMSQVGSAGGMQVFAGKNAIDKFVVVKNSGKSDAYVRTIVAIECGSTDGQLVKKSDRAGNGNPWVVNTNAILEINGNSYNVYEYVYRGASDVNRHVDGVLTAGETTYPSLCQVYLKHNATNEDVTAIDGNANGKLDILVLSQAVQVEGFKDAQTALDTAFGEVNTANVAEWFAPAPETTDDAND